MSLYLDSSALVKLVVKEPESAALRRYLRRTASDRRVTAALSRVEVVRAVAAGGPSVIAHARRLLARIDQLSLDRDLLDDAAILAPGGVLQSLDAIHLAAAQSLGGDLIALVTYDRRMQEAATRHGIAIEAPTSTPT